MGGCRVRLGVLAVVALLGRGAAAEDPSVRVGEAARRFASAFETGDESVQSLVAGDPLLDPVDVAATLYVWHVSNRGEPGRPRDRLGALRALAAQTATRADARGLVAMVDTLAGLDGDTLRGEEERRRAWSAAHALPDVDARATALRRLADGDAGPPTLLAAAIVNDAARTLAAVGRHLDAAERYAVTARLAETLPWPRLAVRAWEQCAREHVALAAWRPAVEALERAVRASEPLGNERDVVSILVSLAAARRRLGRVEGTLEAARRAEAIALRIGEPRLARSARQIRGAALVEVGDWENAERLLRDLAKDADDAGDGRAASEARINLGILLHRTGRLAEALTLTEQEIERLSPKGPSASLAIACRNAAVFLRQMGFLERAALLHERALATYDAVGDRQGVAASLLNLGVVAELLGRLDDARERYRSAVRARATGGDVRESMLALLNLARMERVGGRAAEALALCDRAQAQLREAGLPPPATLWQALAHCHAALGDEERSLAFHADAVRVAESTGTAAGTAAEIFHDAAAALHRAGRSADALPLVRRCLEVRRDAMHGLDPVEAAGLGARVAEAASLGVSVVAAVRATGRLEEGAAAAEAFRFVEWGRALALAEALASRETLSARALSDDLREADFRSRGELDRARKRLDETLAGGEDRPIARARATLSEAHASREEVVARLHRAGSTAAQVAWPEPIDVEAACALLRPADALVLYAPGADRLYAVVVRASGPRLVDLGPAADVGDQVSAWLRLASVPGGPEEELATRLFERLLAPLAPMLEGTETWTVVPDGPTSFLPFDGLRDPATGARAVERATVVVVPSVTVLTALRTKQGGGALARGVLALGDPAYGEGERAHALGFGGATRLPASGEEARAVAAAFPESRRTLLLGEAATGRRLRRALGAALEPFRAVHLACHARVDPAHARLSGLLLAGGDVFDLDDVHRLRVDADVVVLSGCETARGRLLSSEGVLGLTRGFFVAGARRVVASSWKVEDAATLRLMRRFYALLVGGAAPAVALALAKREVLREGGEDAHPSRWAAFVHWGPAD